MSADDRPVAGLKKRWHEALAPQPRYTDLHHLVAQLRCACAVAVAVVGSALAALVQAGSRPPLHFRLGQNLQQNLRHPSHSRVQVPPHQVLGGPNTGYCLPKNLS